MDTIDSLNTSPSHEVNDTTESSKTLTSEPKSRRQEIIHNFIEGAFEATLITEEEFKALSDHEKFQYLCKLQRQGLLSVARDYQYRDRSTSLGKIFGNMQSFLYRMIESVPDKEYVRREPLIELLSQPVESTQQGDSGGDRAVEHNWFRPEILENLEDLSTLAKLKVNAAVQKGIANTDREENSYLPAEDSYQYTKHGEQIVSTFRTLIKRGVLERPEDTSWGNLVDGVTSLEALLSVMDKGVETDEDDESDPITEAGNFLEAFHEAQAAVRERAEVVVDIQEISSDIKEIYEAIAPVYVDYADMVLERMAETKRPVIFLFRDGQFLRKVCREVAKQSEVKVNPEQFQEGMLSRTVFRTVTEKKRMYYYQVSSLIQSIGFGLSQNDIGPYPELSTILTQIDELEDKQNAFANVSDGETAQNRIREQIQTLQKILIERAEKITALTERYDVLWKQMHKEEKDFVEQRDTLVAYLEHIGAFEPFVDFADTGLLGSIMEEVSNYRGEYWDEHFKSPDFIQKLATAYKVSVEDIESEPQKFRNVYTGGEALNDTEGHVLRTYMVATTLEKGDNQQGYFRNTSKQFGAVFSVIDSKLLASLGYEQGQQGLVDKPIMELTHVIESRLNGYMNPIAAIHKTETGFTTKHGETLQDRNENVKGVTLPKRRSDARMGGVEITGDSGRISLNFAAMRHVLETAKELAKKPRESSVRENTARAMEALVAAGPELREILRFKSPTKEALEAYKAVKSN